VAVFSRGAETFPGALAFDTLLRTAESPAVMQAFDAILPDDHAKYLLTSGSTGHPKVVINTHRMLCANMQMMAQVWRFLEHEKPVLVDWLPWSHTFGGNHNLDLVLSQGGTLYIDEGPAGAGPGRQEHPQPARGAAHAVVQRAARLRDGAAGAGGRRRPGARRLRPHAHGVLRRRRAAAGHLGAAGGGGAPRARPPTRRCGSPPAGAAPRPARPSPARIGSSIARVSSACRCRGWS
jgi:hypothetical protein